MLIVNLYGGPGTGKSTTRAKIFAEMKIAGIRVEEVYEYAKEILWEERYNILSDQIYIFAKQNRRLERLRDKVDVVITDSPLLLSLVYTRAYTDLSYQKEFEQLVTSVYNTYNNYNIMLERSVPYQTWGRNEDKEQCLRIDELVYNVIGTYDCDKIDVLSVSTSEIVKKIVDKL